MKNNIHEILNLSDRPFYFPDYILIRDTTDDELDIIELQNLLFDDKPPSTYKRNEYSILELIKYCFSFNKLELLHTIKENFNEETVQYIFKNLTQDRLLLSIISNKDTSFNEKTKLLQFFINNTPFNWKATDMYGKSVFFKALEHGLSNYFDNVSDDDITKHFNLRSVVTKKPLFENFINQNTSDLEKQIPTFVKLYPKSWDYFKEKYSVHQFFNIEKQKSPIIRDILMNYHTLKNDIESEITTNTKKNKPFKF